MGGVGGWDGWRARTARCGVDGAVPWDGRRKKEKGVGWTDGWTDGVAGTPPRTATGCAALAFPSSPPPSSSPLAPCPRPPPVGVSGGRPEDPRGWEAGRVAAEDGSVWPECERVCGEGG
ncbi:hypothetical protein EG871_14640 [Enterococcus faecium]|nr:hypothetical protein EG871_14640 [Enterococcus faecium]